MAVWSRASQLDSKAPNRPWCSGGQLQRPGEAFPTTDSYSQTFSPHLGRNPPLSWQLIATLSLHYSLGNQSRHYTHPRVKLFYTSSNYIMLQRRYVIWDGHRVTNVSGLKSDIANEFTPHILGVRESFIKLVRHWRGKLRERKARLWHQLCTRGDQKMGKIFCLGPVPD